MLHIKNPPKSLILSNEYLDTEFLILQLKLDYLVLGKRYINIFARGLEDDLKNLDEIYLESEILDVIKESAIKSFDLNNATGYKTEDILFWLAISFENILTSSEKDRLIVTKTLCDLNKFVSVLATNLQKMRA